MVVVVVLLATGALYRLPCEVWDSLSLMSSPSQVAHRGLTCSISTNSPMCTYVTISRSVLLDGSLLPCWQVGDGRTGFCSMTTNPNAIPAPRMALGWTMPPDTANNNPHEVLLHHLESCCYYHYRGWSSIRSRRTKYRDPKAISPRQPPAPSAETTYRNGGPAVQQGSVPALVEPQARRVARRRIRGSAKRTSCTRVSSRHGLHRITPRLLALSSYFQEVREVSMR